MAINSTNGTDTKITEIPVTPTSDVNEIPGCGWSCFWLLVIFLITIMAYYSFKKLFRTPSARLPEPSVLEEKSGPDRPAKSDQPRKEAGPVLLNVNAIGRDGADVERPDIVEMQMPLAPIISHIPEPNIFEVSSPQRQMLNL